MNVNLFWLSNSKEGGYRSHFLHLNQAMKMYGHIINVYRITNRMEKSQRKFIADSTYRNVIIEEAVRIAKEQGGIIFTAYWPHNPEHISELLKAGCSIVLQGGHEMYEELLKEIAAYNSRLIVIGKVMKSRLDNLGLKISYIPLPYIPTNHDNIKIMNAISVCRVDWIKNTHMIIQANRLLYENSRIHMYTSCINRMYVYNKLRAIDNEWDKYLHERGKYIDDSPVPYMSKANYCVDMTSINKDGGRVQYTFLEAFNARNILVVNRKWLNSEHSEINIQNSIPVDSVDELVSVLLSDPCKYEHILVNGIETMNEHAPSKIIPLYEELLSVK